MVCLKPNLILSKFYSKANIPELKNVKTITQIQNLIQKDGKKIKDE